MENIIQQIALDLVEKIIKKLLKQKFLIWMLWLSMCCKTVARRILEATAAE